jgi:tetratricopeptide (TPR) repeat protein
MRIRSAIVRLLLVTTLFSTADVMSAGAPSATLPWPDLGKTAAKSPGGGAKDAALLVAIERYPFLEDKPVTGARRNLNDWQLYLTKTRGVPVENVVLLRDDQATREKILNAAADIAKRVQAGGTLWFLFIGHGAPSTAKKAGGVLLGVDTQNDADSLGARGVSQSELLTVLGKGKHARTVAILDSCFSGRSSSGSTLVAGLQPIVAVNMDAAVASGAVLLAAAQGNEFAGPLPGGNRPAFSYLMLAALRGWGDSNGDGKVTVSEAVQYAHRALQALLVGRHQTPNIVGPADNVAVASAGESGPDLGDWQRMMDDTSGPALVSVPPLPPRPEQPQSAVVPPTTQQSDRPVSRISGPTVMEGPTLTLEGFLGANLPRKEIVVVRASQIRYLEDQIKLSSEDDPLKPDYYFRLGELLTEKLRSYMMEGRLPDLQQKTFKDEQDKDFAYTSLQAVKSYVAASKYPKYARMDEVLFRLADLLRMIKKEDQAREFYHRLIKEFPNSKYVPNSYLAFGEFYFQMGEMVNAGKFYEKVELFPGSAVFGFALYKKGWVEINLGNYKSALEIFVKVIQLCENSKIPKNQAGPIEKEARKDLVLAFARTPGASPDKAWDFFQRMGGADAPKMLESLAKLYWEQRMFPESSKIYRKIITLNENSPRLCEWQNKILRNTLSAGNKTDQLQELKRLGLVYEAMLKNPDVKKDVMTECARWMHSASDSVNRQQ